jgi:NAD(P)-dependent dehydrogenase (short-subunit alcohol dehydrogenase family)
VELWDLRAEELEAARAKLAARHPGRVHAERVDVANADAVERAAAAAEARGPVSVLLNCAGISSHRKPAVEIAQADWDRMLAVNLTGCWNTCRAFGRPMLARGAGSVINIASTNAVDPSPGIAHYCVSKAGVAMLTKALAVEWAARQVRVNAVAPGPIETPLTLPILAANPALRKEWEARVPMGRLGAPRDLVGTFVYLAGDASSWVTGQVLYVEGGWLL